MTTKEDHQSNAPNDDRSQSCRRRLILWSDSESKGYESKDRINEIIEYLKKETIWIPNVRFCRRESKPSCAKESEQLMEKKKLLEYPYWKLRFSDNSNLLQTSKLEAEIIEILDEQRKIQNIPTIMVMVPSSEAGFRGLLNDLTDKTPYKFRGIGSKERPFVALLQNSNERESNSDWTKVRSLIRGHWELVKCFPEVEDERKGGTLALLKGQKGDSYESFSEGENPGTLTGNSGKEGRKYISIENNSVARTGIQGTPTKEVVAPPAPAPTPP